MSDLYVGVALFLVITLLIGLWRIHRGPTRIDRMLAAQLFGTTGTAILLLFAEVFAMRAARDVALVFTLLAVVNVFAFTLRRWAPEPRE